MSNNGLGRVGEGLRAVLRGNVGWLEFLNLGGNQLKEVNWLVGGVGEEE